MKYQLVNKITEEIVTPHYVGIAPNGELYSDGMNVTDHYFIRRFTGIKDKNNTDIYESDIVKHKSGGLCSVKWMENECRFALVKIPGEFEIYKTNYSLWKMSEVVGNIYENKDLFNQQQGSETN